MCGIVGYIGKKEATTILLNGLKELEYRGYDSAGIAVLDGDGISTYKAIGKLDNLVQKVATYRTKGVVASIGHTRWATHGKPTEINAHPHGLTHSQVVHNGIIENYVELKDSLQTTVISQTDSEVIVHIFEQEFSKHEPSLESAKAAFTATLAQLHGAYAILLVSEHLPGYVFFAREGSPLQLSFENDECYFASSDSPLIEHCNETVYLEDGQWGVASSNALELFDAQGGVIVPKFTSLPASSLSAKKEGFRYFMEKEIYEQPVVAADILNGRIQDNRIMLNEVPADWLRDFTSVTLCACGTSYHAALVASYLIERHAKVACKVEIASELRYRDPILDKTGLFIVISQSGETADTLEAIKLAKQQGVATLALCNVDNSSIVREAEHKILLRAGIEKGVASTKAFTAQVLTLWLLSVYWGQTKNTLDLAAVQYETLAMRASLDALKVSSKMHEKLHRLSKRYLHGHGFFFIGRDIFYPLALEGALKLKEISYLHAEGYPAGEMKHGPIALADAQLFTIALMARSTLYEKVKSNVEELSARDSTIVAISSMPFELADDLILTNEHEHPMLEFFEMLIVVQLLSMEIAMRLGNDVDMPRNLAKSVTVE